MAAVVLSLPSRAEAQYRPDLFFREDWAEIPAEIPLNPDHLSNDVLSLQIYGPGSDLVKKSHHDQPSDDPYYVWSGRCKGNWAVTLRHKEYDVDLSEYSNIVWRTRQSGFRCLHPILKLADGTWLVGNRCDGPSADWRIRQINLADITWYTLDIDTIVEGRPVENPDLSKVEEIGFTDLMRGGGSPASSRLDWIEVYGRPVER